MLSRRLTRRLCAWIAATLLLMQSLGLAQACTGLGLPAPASAHTQHCPDADSKAADARLGVALCKAHCNSEQPAPTASALPDLPRASDLPPVSHVCMGVLTTPAALDGQWAEGFSRQLPGATAPPGWPPIYLTHGVLRN